MSYSKRKEILFSVVFLTLSLLVFSTSYIKISNVKNNDLNLVSNLIEKKKVPINDNSITNTVFNNDTIIRSGSTMHIEGTYLYLIENYFDLEIYDISNLEEPVLLSSYNHLELRYDNKMIIQNNYIYISSSWGYFYVLNRTNPLAITEVAKLIITEDVINFAINNWSLNLITETKYQIYDFENFTTPTLVGEYTNLDAYFGDLTIKGNYSYILDGKNGFEIINKSNKSDIYLAYQSTLNETNIYSALYINDTSLFIIDGTDDLLYIYDITLPLIPSLIATSDIIADIYGLSNKGSLLFLITWYGFEIYDISDLPTVFQLSSYDSNYHVSVQTLIYYNNHIIFHNDFIGELQERFPIHIVNINTPNNPVHIYPTGNKYGLPDWLFPLLITGGVLIIVGPLIVLLIIVIIRKKNPQYQT